MLIFIEVSGLGDVVQQHGSQTSEEMIRQVAGCARQSLSPADLLFRCGANQFVALLGDADLKTANAIAERMRVTISGSHVSLKAGQALTIQAAVTCVPSQNVVNSLRELMAAADLHRTSPRRDQSAQVH